MHQVARTVAGEDHRAVRRRPPAPGPRPVLWREFAIGLSVFGLYIVVTAMGGASRRATATAHALDLFDLEKRLHIDIELSLNRWLLHHHTLRVAANYEYAFTYILSAFILLIWLYIRHPEVYRWARSSFVVLNLLAIACFAFYPVAPPRLLPQLGFIDTVTQGHTFGSWGSSAVSEANSLAAMPSLHIGWALWVSVVLGYVAGSLISQAISFVHVVVTLLVILATANHYLVDAIGGAVFVLVSVGVAGLISRRPGTAVRPERVAAADAFFLHVETPAAPQHVGGLLVLDAGGTPADRPSRDDVEALVRSRIGALPRFSQRLSSDSGWRRPRWVDVADGEIDWSWHITAHDLRGPEGIPGGIAGLNAYIASLQATPLPRDRPLWRVAVISGVTDTWSAVAVIAHHVIADGFGTVQHAVRLLLEPEIWNVDEAGAHGLSTGKRIAGTMVGLAQLACDGRPSWVANGSEQPGRRYCTVSLPFDDFREVARRHGVRVTDLVLCVVAGALSRVTTRRTQAGDDLRVSVTLMVPSRGSGAEGNATAAAMIDVPLAAMPETERLAVIAGRSGRLRSGTRPLASRFVMDAVAERLPTKAHAWFSRTVYGRRYFHAVASNMPGPPQQLSLAGHRADQIYPILPLAPGTPVAAGALNVAGQLGFGITVHPSFVSDVSDLERAVEAAYDELRAAARTPVPDATP